MNRVLFRRIVCAGDLSDRAVPGLRRALQLAHLHGAELFVIHVTNGGRAATESAERTGTEAFTALRRLTAAEPYDAVQVRWIIAHGTPAIELARFIRRTDADLAIVGGALPRPSTGVMGTIAQAILRTTACPVLVMPRASDDSAAAMPYREILCGLSSGLSADTLRYALSFAQEFESRLTILTVEDSVTHADEDRIESDVDGLRAEIPDSAHEWSVIDDRLATGEPAQELVKTARQIGTDLVVVGSTGTPGFDGGLGSVALGALTLTNANVLIVPVAELAREMDARRAA